MKILNAIVCTDINGATSFHGTPVFRRDPFVDSCFELFTANAVVVEPLMDFDHTIMVKEEDFRYAFESPMAALDHAMQSDNEEIWIMGGAPEVEVLLPYCQNLIVIEVHETAPRSDAKFGFDYSGWTNTTRKECSIGGRKIGVYFYENPGLKNAA